MILSPNSVDHHDLLKIIYFHPFPMKIGLTKTTALYFQ